MIKPVWFKRYRPEELPAAFERVVQSWDTANKASELSDFSVCTSWGITGPRLFLLDVLRARLDYPDLKRAVRAEYARLGPDVVLIEDKASGTQLIQELVAEGMHAVARYRPQADKVMRMHAQTATIENGFVHLPQAADWLAEYLHELAVFPHGRYDDQVELDGTVPRLVQDVRPRGRHLHLLPAARRGTAPQARRRAPLTRPGRKAIFWRKICGVARGAPLRGREPAQRLASDKLTAT